MNPFFRETLDETGEVYEEEIARDPRNNTPLPDNVDAQTFPVETGGVLESTPMELSVDVGPTSPPQVGPELDTSILTDEEIDRQIAELTGAAGEEEDRTSFFTALKNAENAVKAGYDEEAGVWKPHTSLEGGTDTLGYGHKLTPREAKGGFVIINGEKVDTGQGLTDEQVNQLFEQDVRKAEAKVAKEIKDFDSLPQKYKDILVNITFNTGSVTEKGWPKLLQGMRQGNDDVVRREMVTSYKDEEGTKVTLQERANEIASSVMG